MIKLPSENKRTAAIAISVVAAIIAAVIGVGIYTIVTENNEEKTKKEASDKAFDTSLYSQEATEENEYQFSDTVIEIDSKVFAIDSSKITVRESGTNDEKTLVKANLDPGMVTDAKTLYYYDLDTLTIMSVDVASLKTKEVVKPLDNVKPDLKTTFEEYIFARFDGMYGDNLYYQIQEGEEYMPNYMVNVKTGEVTKLKLADYGTYKLQIADGKLYFDMYRTMNTPSILFTANPDGSDIETLAEGITNFEVIGNKIYYFKVESMTEGKNKIMTYDIKTGVHTLVKDGMTYTSGGFTSYGMISDMSIGDTLHTVITYYDGAGEALAGNGAKICGEVAIIHAGVPEDITAEDAMEMARVPEWYLVGNRTSSEIITLPENTTPVNFKDGYFYYYTYSAEGKTIMNRTKVKF